MNSQKLDKYFTVIVSGAVGMTVALVAAVTYVYMSIVPVTEKYKAERNTAEKSLGEMAIAVATIQRKMAECEAKQGQVQEVAVTATVAAPPTPEPAPPDGPYPDPGRCQVDDVRAIHHDGGWNYVVVKACRTLGPTDTPFTIIRSDPGLDANPQATLICNAGKQDFANGEPVFICAFR